MKRLAVDSSNIKGIGYNSEMKLLEIEFRNGSVYQYPSTTEVEYNSLMAAESVGSHFNKNLRTKPFVLVPREIPAEETPKTIDVLDELESQAKAYSKFHLTFTCTDEELKMKDNFSAASGAYVQTLIAVVRKQRNALIFARDVYKPEHPVIDAINPITETLAEVERMLKK